jgi:hypothetical protein
MNRHHHDVLMESRMRGDSHVRFGGRRRGDHRPQGRHWRLAADPARRPPEANSSNQAKGLSYVKGSSLGAGLLWVMEGIGVGAMAVIVVASDCGRAGI